MSRLTLTALFLLILTPRLTQATPQAQYYMMTKPAPPTSCSAALASLPTAYTTFATTEKAAYLWFYVTGVNAGDVFATEYYTPAGQIYTYTSGSFDPLPTAGNWCLTDVPFEIAGFPPRRCLARGPSRSSTTALRSFR